jgi:hypothetical protein
MERRKYRRVPFEVTAAVQTDHISINGMVDNLSMNGMFLTTEKTVACESPLEIAIILSGSSSMLSIRLKGRVVRQTEAGMAVEFQEMDLDSFIHLRNIIAQNSDDPDAVYEEYYQTIIRKGSP